MAIALALIDIWAIHSRCLLLLEKTYKTRKLPKPQGTKFAFFDWEWEFWHAKRIGKCEFLHVSVLA